MVRLRPVPVRLGLGTLALAAGLSFYWWNFGRAASIGFDAGLAARAAVGVGILAHLLMLPLLLVVLAAHRVRMDVWEERVARGRCAACTYPVGRADVCPECGRETDAPLPRRQAVRLAVWFVVAVMLGTAAGSAAAEGWILLDEARFRREARAAVAEGTGWYFRARAWPNRDCELHYRADTGFWAAD